MLLGNPIFVLLLLVQFVFIPPPLPDGCQSSHEYPRASSFDMVGRADIIVVAEAQSPSISDPHQISASEMPPVRLRTIRTIKGSAESEFSIPAAFYAGGPGGDPEKTECNFWQTAVGDRHVLFLTRRADGSLQTLHAPSTDIAAPYRSDDHPWIELIQTYMAMQRDLSPSRQWRRLEQMAKERMRPAASEREQWQAREIVDHLRSISRYQQTDHLLSLWSHTEQRTMPAWGFRFHTDVNDDYDSRPWPEFLTLVPPQADDESWNHLRQRILEALADGNHPGATPFFLELVDQQPSVTRVILVARHLANSGRPMESLILMERRFMDLLVEEDYRLQKELPAIVDALNGPDNTSPNFPLWRQDPALARRWPKLAFQLHRAMGSKRESTKLAMLDAAGEIEFTAYDDDYMTTMDLATTSDMRVIAWAKAELAKLDSTPGMSGWTRSYLEHPLQRPLAVLLKRGDMADIEPAVLDLFCRGGEFREVVIHFLGYHGEQLDLLARMLATDGLTTNERRRVADALVQVYGRFPYGDDLYHGDFDEPGPTRFLLLADIVKGGKGPASPIPCPARQ